MIYKHYKKKDSQYIIINAGEMQINDEWFEATIYQDIHSKKVYVRQSEDFDLKFKIL